MGVFPLKIIVHSILYQNAIKANSRDSASGTMEVVSKPLVSKPLNLPPYPSKIALP